MKKRIDLSFLNKLAVVLLFTSSISNCVFISNNGARGLLGDQLLNYVQAKYLSYKYNIPFRLKNFKGVEEFVLDQKELKINRIRNPIEITNESQLRSINPNKHYFISYYCKITEWANALDIDTWHTVLNNPKFRAHLRQLINTKQPVIVSWPQNTLAVAVHIRRLPAVPGARLASCQFYDITELTRSQTIRIPPAADVSHPYKFPPLQYYADQLKRLVQLYPSQNITVYIFTNDPNPETICKQLKQEVSASTLEFKFKKDNPDKCIATDLVALSRFPYLIRPISNFSQISDLIGEHQLVISPKNMAWYKDKNEQDCMVVETITLKEKQLDGTYVIKTLNNM